MARLLIEKSILKTLAYGDVFGWPMNEDEIFTKTQSSKSKAQSDKLKLKTGLKQLLKENKIGFKNGLYFLYGKEVIVEKRLQREKWAIKKMQLAKKSAEKLKIIPSILLVGVSGGLSVGNADKNDDIDFFIICRSGTLWTTRFLSTLLLDILGKRRKPNDKKFKDKICLNMFVDEKGMIVPKKEKDLYTAHEVVQMKPLWDRGVHDRFLEGNKWVNEFFSSAKRKMQSVKSSGKFKFLSFVFSMFEPVLAFIQKKYMSNRRTSEKIEPHRLMFHPEDKREWVMREYLDRVQPYVGLNPIQL